MKKYKLALDAIVFWLGRVIKHQEVSSIISSCKTFLVATVNFLNIIRRKFQHGPSKLSHSVLKNERTVWQRNVVISLFFWISCSYKKLFAKCVCYWYVLVFGYSFGEYFLFHYIIGRHIFHAYLSLPWGFLQPPCCCVFWNKTAFWKKSVFYVRYLHKSIKMLLIPNVKTQAFTF